MKNKKRSSKKGLTLVETIISVALLAIVAIFFCSVFVYCAGAIAILAKQKQSSNKAAGGIEIQDGNVIATSPDYTVSTSSGSFSINFNGNVISSNGSYVESNNGNAKYKDYIPNK